MLDLDRGEHLFFYRLPAEFAHEERAAIRGARHGSLGRFGSFEVHQNPQIDVFGHLDDGDRMGQEFGLSAGTYIGFVYEPTGLAGAQDGPTTDTLSFTVDDDAGLIRHCLPFAISIPTGWFPTGLQWSPRSCPNTPDGSIDVTRLDALTGSTYLPTGEVVFEVSAADFEDDDVMVTVTQPSHGTLVTLGDSSGEVVRLVYTPDQQYRTDPTVYTDSFTFQVDDGSGLVTVTTVPVLIAKEAIVNANACRPYLGNASFTGRVDAPFDDVQGYLAVATALLSESIGSMIDNPCSVGSTLFGAVTINDEGVFTYTRDPDWAELPVEAIDDSFAVIAYSADNRWAAAVVPVGGTALATYPPLIDIVDCVATSLVET